MPTKQGLPSWLMPTEPKLSWAAAEAGVDSVEHGAYLSTQALEAMAAAGTVWVPTLSTIGNLRGTGRFSESDVEQILASAQAGVASSTPWAGIGPRSDAGAYAVFHGAGGLDEFRLLSEALGPAAEAALDRGISAIPAAVLAVCLSPRSRLINAPAGTCKTR